VRQFDPSLPDVAGERDRLVQVFINLIKNAAEAMPREQTDAEIVLGTAYRSPVRIVSADRQDRISLPIEITVRDNGKGIEPDIAASLFQPFVTSKPNGSGLGLATVAKIIEEHRGIIECDSVPRRTIFRVLLPVHQPAARQA
jgi:two-component system, NtrC family, nitrogen regulation sensor histidine kinase GlnL